MAKVLVAFYNCMNVPENPNAMPAFYETFIEGMIRAGNEVKTISHAFFGIESFPKIDTYPELEDQIKAFSPDICFIFNNCLYDISDIVDCPIVVYEVDSPNYYSNIEILKEKKDRFLHFVLQSSSRDFIRENWGIEDKYIFDVPFFTEVRAKDCGYERNIGFIGTNFVNTEFSVTSIVNLAKPSLRDRLIYNKILDLLENNPNIEAGLVGTLINEMGIDAMKDISPSVIKGKILTELSGEKRIGVLGTIQPLGLEIFGTKNWADQYYANTALARAYNPTQIYTKAHNEYIYNTSRIGINVSHLQAVTGFPWRVMDILASNACLVSDYHLGFESVFGEISGIIPTYENAGDAYRVCRELLNDEKKRRYIVAACQEYIDEKYRFINCLNLIEQYSGVSLHI